MYCCARQSPLTHSDFQGERGLGIWNIFFLRNLYYFGNIGYPPVVNCAMLIADLKVYWQLITGLQSAKRKPAVSMMEASFMA